MFSVYFYSNTFYGINFNSDNFIWCLYWEVFAIIITKQYDKGVRIISILLISTSGILQTAHSRPNEGTNGF